MVRVKCVNQVIVIELIETRQNPQHYHLSRLFVPESRFDNPRPSSLTIPKSINVILRMSNASVLGNHLPSSCSAGPIFSVVAILLFKKPQVGNVF
jgi:hypothetical protein